MKTFKESIEEKRTTFKQHPNAQFVQDADDLKELILSYAEMEQDMDPDDEEDVDDVRSAINYKEYAIDDVGLQILFDMADNMTPEQREFVRFELKEYSDLSDEEMESLTSEDDDYTDIYGESIEEARRFRQIRGKEKRLKQIRKREKKKLGKKAETTEFKRKHKFSKKKKKFVKRKNPISRQEMRKRGKRFAKVMKRKRRK